MAIGNICFHPSIVEDRIYVLMDHFLEGVELYNTSLLEAVSDMMARDFPEVDWTAQACGWQDCEGECVSFAWVEDGHLHMIGWDVKYTETPPDRSEYWRTAGHLNERDFWRAIRKEMGL